MSDAGGRDGGCPAAQRVVQLTARHALLRETDAVAEVHNTLRVGLAVERRPAPAARSDSEPA